LQKKETVSKIGGKNWVTIILLGLAGQIAWNVENSWFNTFVYDTITPDPKPIAWMVAISAITATITTLVMGTYSDRVGKRRPFIFFGYILWGVSTILFPTTAFIKTTSLAVVMVIIADTVMTFLGSTANDAAFNAWTTDISDESNRGKLSAVITILPLLAALIGSALSGVLIDQLGYFPFFFALGAIVSISGLVGGIMLKDSPGLKKQEQKEGNFLLHILNVFKPQSLKKHKEMFLVFAALCLFSIGFQVFLPYQMIYMNNYLGLSKTLTGALVAIPILISMVLAVPAGKLADKGHSQTLALAAPIVSFLGFVLLSFARESYQLVLTGSLVFIGFVVLLSCLGAWIKNLMPRESRGQFEGVRMIFNVAIPMVIGPAIGSFLISRYGIPTVINGEPGFIPTPILLQVTAIVSATCLVPLYLLYRGRKTGSFGKAGVQRGA